MSDVLLAAERIVLGTAMEYPDALETISEQLASGDFYDTRHGTVYAYLSGAWAADDPTGPVALANRLDAAGELKRVGGLPYLHDLYAAAVPAASVGYYASLVAANARTREVKNDAIRLDQAAGDTERTAAILAEIADRNARRANASSGLTGRDYWAKRVSTGGSFVLDTPDRTPAVWGEGNTVAWAQGEALMLCGPAGVGKTTLTVQLIAARMGIGAGRVLDMPVRPGTRKMLYLAMDRPPQIARAMARLFTANDREALDEKLVVWKGPPPFDLAKQPETLVRMCEQASADTVVVDSLKDGVSKLSGDEEGNLYNKARQLALNEGIEVIEQHHQRKAGGDNKKPSKLEDVYGSTWLTAGAGSVFVLWGEAGDPVVELIHLKQPAEPVGPLMVEHDHKAGRSKIHHQLDILAMAKLHSAAGLNPRTVASTMFSTNKPTEAQIQKARRKLSSHVEKGHLVAREGYGQTPTVYFLAERDVLC